MSVEQYFICRHGDYDDYGDITPKAREKAEILGAQIGSLIGHMSREVLTSPAPRARQTAAIIAEILGVTAEEIESLWDDNEHPGDVAVSMKRIDDCRTKAIVVMTHLHFVKDIPRVIAVRYSLPGATYLPVPNKSESLYIDVPGKTASKLNGTERRQYYADDRRTQKDNAGTSGTSQDPPPF
jgi:phosphohistidine phosphatase SixA